MKPIVKWSGGKTKEIPLFEKWYPENFDVYIEPFVGGGAVFFDLQPNKSVINDVHSELINFYTQLKLGNGEKIFEYMKKYNNDEETYYYVRDNFIPSNDIEKAFVFFYLRKTCFRGMLRYNKNGKFNIPFGRYKTYNYDILLDKDYEEVFKNTEILNKSFEEIFKTYNNKDNFVFLDPPYDSIFTDYGYCEYDKKKHLELFNCFKNTENKCLMVIGKTDFIADLYKDYIVDMYGKKYAFKIHSGRVGDEINTEHLVIKNY